MRWIKGLFILLAVVLFIYFIGPQPDDPVYTSSLPLVPALDELDFYIRSKESLHKLRPNNNARIIWADSTKRLTKTRYCIVYLHGFSASQEEGSPVHKNIALRLGCNLYLSRLAEHGIDTSEQLLKLSPENYWESAKHALAVGKRLGDQVILMGTSTGASLALQLAATFPSDVHSLILYSPNIEINDRNAWLLNNPWGLQIARLVKSGKYQHPEDDRPVYRQYWNKPYRLEALVSLQELLETTMTKTLFSKINKPVLLLYYYKDSENQDPVVKVSGMMTMFSQLSTPAALKRKVAMPNTGNHVLASPIKSHDIVGVEKETISFMRDVLRLQLE